MMQQHPQSKVFDQAGAWGHLLPIYTVLLTQLQLAIGKTNIYSGLTRSMT